MSGARAHLQRLLSAAYARAGTPGYTRHYSTYLDGPRVARHISASADTLSTAELKQN